MLLKSMSNSDCLRQFDIKRNLIPPCHEKRYFFAVFPRVLYNVANVFRFASISQIGLHVRCLDAYVQSVEECAILWTQTAYRLKTDNAGWQIIGMEIWENILASDISFK